MENFGFASFGVVSLIFFYISQYVKKISKKFSNAIRKNTTHESADQTHAILLLYLKKSKTEIHNSHTFT